MEDFRGAWPALITPTAADGSVNIASLRQLTGYLAGKRISGLYVCGSTGEGLYLSVDERKLVTETVMAELNGRVPVIVHVGAVATRDAVALAKHARRFQANGVSSVLPTLNADMQSVYLHYQAIAAAVPDLPFFPYLFGARTDAGTLMAELLKRIPNLGGAKYTGPDMFEISKLIAMPGPKGWTIFSGMDEQCVFAAMFGIRGNIGSTLNVMPGVYVEIRRLVDEGEWRRAVDLQLRVNKVTQTLISFGFTGALREALRLIGIDCGDPRLPIPPLPAERRTALHEQLQRDGFKDLVAM